MPWRRPDERARRTRAHAAARSSGRSTPAWCAGRGSSSPCRCCSQPSPSAGPSHCRRRRCRPRSTERPPSSLHASSPGTTRIELPDQPAASAPPNGSRSSWPSTTSSCRRTASRPASRAAAVSSSRTSSRVVRGDSQRAIVITAHRDNNGEGRGANDNASGTAALIELARAYAPVAGTTLQTRPSHTLVFVSTDGGAFGALGAARFAEHSPYRSDALAVISLDAIAGVGPPQAAHRRRHGPFAGGCARAHCGGSGARAVRSRAGACVRHPPAARPRLSVHLRRAGAVCRPRHPGGDAHHRSGRSVAGLRGRPAQRRAPGRARPRDPEPRRLARRRPRACAGNDQLRVPRSAIRARLDDRARAPDGALAVRDRNDRSLRPVQAAARSPRSCRAQPAQPSSLLGLRRPAALRRRQARSLPGRASRDPSRSTAVCTSPRRWSSRCSACCCSSVGSSPASA